MTLYKRCACADRSKCRHPLWYVFKLRGHRHRGSTFTANHQLAQLIARNSRPERLESREGFRPPKPVKRSVHVKAYLEFTSKTNRSSNKDKPTLDRFVASVGDRPISEVSAFHVERWKRTRADVV